ncbi:MAG: hypothetical protein GX971_02490 [Firmicutes bacterium]|mgnify:CR=1 FL=1|nr:hypothetical protein [Bacillota bacterium]
MNKMRDRLLLGVISGLAGGAVKNVVGSILMKSHASEFGGPARAAGMLLPAHKIATPQGRLVGWLADTAIAGLLGIASVYMLSVTGKDNAALKGAITTGGVAWMGLYGVLGTLGATRVEPGHPRTVLSEFITHSIYGAVTGATACYLGDEGLFNGEIPLFASDRQPAKQISLEPITNQVRY